MNGKSSFLLLALIGIFCIPLNCPADINIVFTEAADGGVDVVGSGSGMVTADRQTPDWDINDFMTEFLDESIGTSQISANTFSGSLDNLTTGQLGPLQNFDVDKDATTGDDLDFDTPAGDDPPNSFLAFLTGDEFEFSLTASFTVSNLAFSDLIEGTHIDLGGGADEIFGITTIVVEGKQAPLLGDVNCDGLVNLLDVDPFITLINRGGFSTKADMNEDGAVNLLDVVPFIDALGGN